MATDTRAILVVDDEQPVRELIDMALSRGGRRCVTAENAEEAKALLADGEFALMICDISLPGLSGLDLLGHVRRHYAACRVVLITGICTTESLADALALGAYDYLPKPFSMEELDQAVSRALSDTGPVRYLPFKAARALQDEPLLRQVSLESIRSLVHAVEAKDPYTRRHSEHVAQYACRLAEWLDVNAELTESIRVASLLHDCGKIGTPDHILTKPGRLTDEEFDYIRRHPAIGFEIIEKMSAFRPQAQLIRAHHENWDGSGYPDGLAGEQIPFGARIINVADAMDAMLMKRTYKEAYPLSKVLDELRRCSGTQFAAPVAAAAIEWCTAHPEQIIQPAANVSAA